MREVPGGARNWSNCTRSCEQRPQSEVERRHCWPRRGWRWTRRSTASNTAGVPCCATACRSCDFSRPQGLLWRSRLSCVGLAWAGDCVPTPGSPPAAISQVSNAGVASSDLENMRISGISGVAPDPQTGGVKITMDAERRVTLEGSLDDPKIQQVLVYAVKSYDNPGIRRDTLDALRSHADNPNIRQALIYAMQHDPNAGVRLEALATAVCGMKSSGDVQSAWWRQSSTTPTRACAWRPSTR